MTEEQTALAKRVIACRGWRWLPGMATNSKFRRVVDACPVERVPCCAEKRAAVVAYLRMEADDGTPMAASALLDVSDAIERGEHRREGKS